MKLKHTLLFGSALLLTGSMALAQESQEAPETPDSAAASADIDEEPSFEGAAGKMQRDLEASLAELAELRAQIAEEKIPLSKQLSALEAELSQVRAEYQETTRDLDSSTLGLSNLRNEIKTREDESAYLSGLLGEYVRNFESRLHIAELARYEESLEAAKLAVENTNLSQQEVFEIQSALVRTSLERLSDALGGTRFQGRAVVDGGLLSEGTFVMVGPCAVFSSADGKNVGLAEQRIGSLEPTQIPFGTEEDTAAALALTSNGGGFLPVDPTLGSAHKIESTRNQTWLEHVQQGGPVMIPIFGMAGIALLIALFKWVGLAFVRKPSRKRVRTLLEAVAAQNVDAAHDAVAQIKGPVGRMLAVGVEHLSEPKELIEEAMYEVVLRTRLRVQRFLPFIAICAASAPLLGLLGTVTGIINTFKMITVFGSGDVKSLSGGISEALITTKFGLIVAIPSLLLHAFLSRKARGVTDQMEAAGVQFVNQVGRTPLQKREIVPVVAGSGSPDPRMVRAQVTEIVTELLGPLAAGDATAGRNDSPAVPSN